MNLAFADVSVAPLPVVLGCVECIPFFAVAGLTVIGGPALVIWMLILLVRPIAKPAGWPSPLDRTDQVAVTHYAKRANASGISHEEITRRLSAAGWREATLRAAGWSDDTIQKSLE